MLVVIHKVFELKFTRFLLTADASMYAAKQGGVLTAGWDLKKLKLSGAPTPVPVHVQACPSALPLFLLPLMCTVSHLSSL